MPTPVLCRYRRCEEPVDLTTRGHYCRNTGHRQAEHRAVRADVLAAADAQRVEAARLLEEDATGAVLVGDLEGALASIRAAADVLARLRP